MILVNQGGTSAGAKRIFDASKKTTARDIPGLGEAAYWEESTGGLYAIKGSYVLNLDIRPLTGKDRMAIARELAIKAIARIP